MSSPIGRRHHPLDRLVGRLPGCRLFHVAAVGGGVADAFCSSDQPPIGHAARPDGGTNPAYSLSAIDAVSLTLLILSLGAELMVLGLTLWLLFQVTWPTPAKTEVTAAMSTHGDTIDGEVV